MIEVKIINESNNDTPALATKGSAGVDVRAFIPSPIMLKPLERKLIPTGLKVEIPQVMKFRLDQEVDWLIKMELPF